MSVTISKERQQSTMPTLFNTLGIKNLNLQWAESQFKFQTRKVTNIADSRFTNVAMN